MFKVVCISDMDDCISLKNRLTRLYFVLLNKPCFLDVQCRPSLIWESLSNLRRALFCFFCTRMFLLRLSKHTKVNRTFLLSSAEVSFLQALHSHKRFLSFFQLLFIYANNISSALRLLLLPPGISTDVKEEL